jgi:hypothetical protein
LLRIAHIRNNYCEQCGIRFSFCERCHASIKNTLGQSRNVLTKSVFQIDAVITNAIGMPEQHVIERFKVLYEWQHWLCRQIKTNKGRV